MTIEFEKNILRYLFQFKCNYYEYLSSEIFDVTAHKGIFELINKYVSTYKSLPDRNNFVEFISNQAALNTEAINVLKNSLVWLYEPLEDSKFIEEKILMEVKKKMFKNVMIFGLRKIDEGLTSEDFDDVHRKIAAINTLDDGQEESGLFLWKDLNKSIQTHDVVYPTFLSALNATTSHGGFRSPELITIMGPPKSFKTGMLIKFMAEFARQGLDGMYCDWENGLYQIRDRFKQALLEVKINEIKDFNAELEQIKHKFLSVIKGGEIYIRKYQKRKEHFGHVEADLIKAMDRGLDPKVMIYDYVNIAGCSDSRIQDPRLKIQKNYADAQNINDRYNTFSMTVAKMKQSAVKKEWPTTEDVAEDFEIVYNSHKVFALMRNEEDIELGLARMISIVQRQGSSYTKQQCLLEIKPENFTVKEINLD